jgi:hypothetical protein
VERVTGEAQFEMQPNPCARRLPLYRRKSAVP